MNHILRISAIALAASAALYGQCTAQTGGDLAIKDQLVTLYPSLVPAHRIHVVSSDPKLYPLGNARLPDYKLLVNNKDATSGILRVVYNLAGGQVVDTSADIEIAGRFFDKKDLIEVNVTINGKTASGAACGGDNSRETLNLTPSLVQSQALRNGQKRPVGQLNVVFDELSLTRKGIRTHLTTNSVISSDAKDASSSANLLFGVEHSLLGSWFLPWHADTKMIGDQVIDNLSWVSSTGLTTNIPWAWTRPVANNPYFDAPVSPEFTVEAQIERRLRQDAASEKKFLDKDAFRLHGKSTWSPLRLLRGDGTGNIVAMEFTGEAWYLPKQHWSPQVVKDRLEGLFQASVLVPVTSLNPNSSGLTGTGAKNQIRVQYSRGANEANGFKHSSKLSIGVEVVK